MSATNELGISWPPRGWGELSRIKSLNQPQEKKILVIHELHSLNEDGIELHEIK